MVNEYGHLWQQLEELWLVVAKLVDYDEAIWRVCVFTVEWSHWIHAWVGIDRIARLVDPVDSLSMHVDIEIETE